MKEKPQEKLQSSSEQSQLTCDQTKHKTDKNDTKNDKGKQLSPATGSIYVDES